MLGGLFGGGDSEEKFWKWFDDKKEQIAAIIDGNLLIQPALEKQLKKYDKTLGYELARNASGENIFYVSTNNVRESIPYVMKMVDVAPKIDGWIIQKFIPRKDIEQPISWNALEMKHESLLFEYTLYKDQAHLRIYIKGYDMKDERYRILSVMFLQAAFGEFDYMTKIGALEYVPYMDDFGDKEVVTLPELMEIVDHQVR